MAGSLFYETDTGPTYRHGGAAWQLRLAYHGRLSDSVCG
jgi:hypothetical protein